MITVVGTVVGMVVGTVVGIVVGIVLCPAAETVVSMLVGTFETDTIVVFRSTVEGIVTVDVKV